MYRLSFKSIDIDRRDQYDLNYIALETKDTIVLHFQLNQEWLINIFRKAPSRVD